MRLPYDVTVILPGDDEDNLTEGVVDLTSIQSYVRIIDDDHGDCTEINTTHGIIRLLIPYKEFKSVMKRNFGVCNWFHLN